MEHYVTVYFKKQQQDEESYKSLKKEDLTSFLNGKSFDRVLVVDPRNHSQVELKN